MSKSKKWKWYKLQSTFFTDLRMKKLRRVAGGEVFTIIYLKMILLSLETDGTLIYRHIEPSFEEEIALSLDEDVDNTKITVAFLIANGLLVEGASDGGTTEYLLTDTINNIGSESDSAHRVRAFRERKEQNKLLTGNGNNMKALLCNAPVTEGNGNVTEKKLGNKSSPVDNSALHCNAPCNGGVTNSNGNVTEEAPKPAPNQHRYIVTPPVTACNESVTTDIDIDKESLSYIGDGESYPQGSYPQPTIIEQDNEKNCIVENIPNNPEQSYKEEQATGNISNDTAGQDYTQDNIAQNEILNLYSDCIHDPASQPVQVLLAKVLHLRDDYPDRWIKQAILACSNGGIKNLKGNDALGFERISNLLSLWRNIESKFVSNIQPDASDDVKQELHSLVNQFNAADVLDACDVAERNHIKGNGAINYIISVLENWQKYGKQTRETRGNENVGQRRFQNPSRRGQYPKFKEFPHGKEGEEQIRREAAKYGIVFA